MAVQRAAVWPIFGWHWLVVVYYKMGREFVGKLKKKKLAGFVSSRHLLFLCWGWVMYNNSEREGRSRGSKQRRGHTGGLQTEGNSPRPQDSDVDSLNEGNEKGDAERCHSSDSASPPCYHQQQAVAGGPHTDEKHGAAETTGFPPGHTRSMNDVWQGHANSTQSRLGLL